MERFTLYFYTSLVITKDCV